MINGKQKTIAKEIIFTGVGLHTGATVQVKLKPANVNEGIRFLRVDLPEKPVIKADPQHLLIDSGLNRCNSIGQGIIKIHTVEHLMSVLSGLGISNLWVEINADELPGLDGSGLDYLKAIQKAGIVEQDASLKIFDVKEPIGVSMDGSSIYVVPAKEFKVSYTLDYEHPFLRSQYFNVVINEQSFAKEIAPARTFCLEEEAQALRARGLGKGASYDNTLVVGEKGVLNNKVRFVDEFARHKILDFIGDLYLLGMPIRGHVFATKSGHALNIELVKKLYEQKERYDAVGIVPDFDLKGQREITINDIMKILPHRFPFLLVDRVIEIEQGKKAIGIKNVTINDHFFQGHFPTRPVMPGVLMIEAMAQTAGVVVLTNEAHHGKVAFFMAVDNVKFRKVVVPGDQLVMEVEVVRDKAKIAQIHAVSKVAGEVVAEADMIFSFTEDSYLIS